MIRFLIYSSVVALTLLPVTAFASPDNLPDRENNSLSASADYESLKEKWREMPPEKRQHLRERFKKFKQLPPERQERIRVRLKQYKNMAPEEKHKLQKRWQRWQTMTPQEKQMMRQRFDRFRELPPGQRKELKRELRDMRELPPQERQQMRQELRKKYFRNGNDGKSDHRGSGHGGYGSRGGSGR